MVKGLPEDWGTAATTDHTVAVAAVAQEQMVFAVRQDQAALAGTVSPTHIPARRQFTQAVAVQALMPRLAVLVVWAVAVQVATPATGQTELRPRAAAVVVEVL
jgi:hypothetical protein